MAAAVASEPRRLSDLPDDVLQRILFFAPAREGATTAVLSRRWRWLWRSSGAVNLDTRSFKQDKPEIEPQEQPSYGYGCEFSTKERQGFLRAADQALAAAAAAAAPVTRLSVVIAEDSKIHPTRLEDFSEHDLVGAVVSHPAAGRVEELLVEVDGWNKKFTFSFGGSLPPSETLRAVRIVGCAPLTATAAAAAFPRLAELRLERCTVPLADLRRIIGAAPQLETLHLESCYIPNEKKQQFPHRWAQDQMQRCRLVLPAVAALVLASCRYQTLLEKVRLDIDAPRLRYFRYQGSVHLGDRISLKPQHKAAASLALVDLDIRDDLDNGTDHITRYQVREPFWRFLRNFSTAKVLKIRVHFTMDGFGVAGKGSQDELLCGLVFSLLERLELQVQYASETSIVMLANLLHCCPVVRDFRLKLRKDVCSTKRSCIDHELRADFNKSVERFRNRRSPMVSLRAEEDDNHEAPRIPGLSDESFDCLRSYLRRVSLSFCMQEQNCLGVQLAKFFAESAMVLEEMYIDDGSQKMCEHMNISVGRSLANN